MKARLSQADALRRGLRASLIVGFTAAILSGLQAGGGSGSGQGAGSAQSKQELRYVEGDVLVKFKASAPQSAQGRARADLGARRLRRFRSRAEHWRLGPGRTTEGAIERLRRNPDVEYAEPDYILKAALAPADPSYPLLWGLNNTGQTGGVSGADIGAEAAWSVSVGDRSVLVGVIDTGIDYTHPDLAENIWTNPGEIPGNGVDDDGNGYVDDVHGWDFYNDDNDPADDLGHGTHVAGTIGAVGDNDRGVVGVAWRVSLLPLKFLNSEGSGPTSGAVAAINYAVDLGVDVLNNSWGGYDFSQTLEDAIRSAEAADIVFVCAAGNNGANNDTQPFYPASYEISNVISVAATDHTDYKAVFSNYGPNSVDLAAPGVDIFSTVPGNHYGSLSGTSMAAPHVSGVAALVRAVAPGIPALQVKQKILDGAVRLPTLASLVATGGRLNALHTIATRDVVPPGRIESLVTGVATSNSIVLHWTATGDDGESGRALAYDVRYSTTAIDDQNFGLARRAAGAPVPGTPGWSETMEVRGLAPDTTYVFTVKALDEWGNPGPFGATASGTTLPPPTFDSAPTAFSVALRTGEATARTLLIRNAGQEGTLDWTIPLPTISGPGGTAQGVLAEADGAGRRAAPRGASPLAGGTGGPDAFGYRFVDSDQPGGPEFVWEDLPLSGRGVSIDSLNADDQISEAIPLGFAFSFYGQTFDAVRVSTNGFLTFTGNSAPYENKPLPGAAAPPFLVAPFWDDLKFQPGFGATYARDPDSFTVQYTGVRPYSGTGDYTFQATLYRTGEIIYRYLSMTGNIGSATIGIQDGSRATALQIAFNSLYLHDGMAIRIYNVPQWLQVSPSSGRLAAGEEQSVVLAFDAKGLEGGAYAGTVFVETNDPLRSIVPHPVTLVVTPVPMIDVGGGALDFGNVFTGFFRTLTLGVRNTGTEVLHVGGIASNDPAVTSSPPAPFTVPVRGTQDVAVTYAPTDAGVLDSSLVITSDAANAPSVPVRLLGTSTPAPEMIVTPLSLGATLLTGATTTRTLRVENRGGSDLEVNVTAEVAGLFPWLSVTPAQATVPHPPEPGVVSALDFTVGLDAGDFGTTTLSGNVVVQSNIPGAPPARIPVTLSVVGAPNIAVSDEPVVIESQQTYTTYGARTAHHLPITYAPAGVAEIEVIAEGNYGTAGEYAQVTAEGFPLGSLAGNGGGDCVKLTGTFPLDAGQMASMLSDGVLDVAIQNSPYVDTFCAANRHTVRLSYSGARDLLDFGPLFLGVRRPLAVAIHNRGSETLKIQSIASDRSEFVPSASVLNIPAQATAALTVTFAPADALSYTGTLTIVSNDPDTPAVSIALRGSGLVAPVIGASPAQFATTLFKKSREVHTLTLSNSGGNALDFSVSLKPRTPPLDPLACAPIAYVSEWSAGRLSAINLMTGATSRVSFGLRTPQENLVLDPGGTIGYVAESDPGTLAAIDLTTGLVTRVAQGLDFPVGVALTPTGETAYVSEATRDPLNGRIKAVDLSTGQVTTLASGLGAPNGLALNAALTTLYFNERGAGRFSKLDLDSRKVTTILSGLVGPNSVALTRDESVAYITETGAGRLWSIDLATGHAEVRVLGLSDPQGLALSADSTAAYVVEFHMNTLTTIDLATLTMTRHGLGLSGPTGVAVVTPGSCRTDFLTVEPAAGRILPGGSLDLTVTYDSSDLFGGEYHTDIEIASNDPARPILRVPATLAVNPICPDADRDGSAVCSSLCALAGNTRCGDCNDADPSVRPFVEETCNGLDDNCNGLIDESIASVDADGDLIGDTCDNCPVVWNPAQEDADGNGVGDVCEPAAICLRANFDTQEFSKDRIDGRDLARFARVFGTCPDAASAGSAANLDLAITGPQACVDLADFHLFMSVFPLTCGGI